MTYENLIKAFELIDEFNTDGSFFITPQELPVVDQTAGLLNVIFPRSYKDFLCRYGSLDLFSLQIFGIVGEKYKDVYIHEDIRSNISRLRTQDNLKFPESFIVIHELGNGELSCLDTSKMNADGECPVVAWYFGATEVLAEDFGAFLLDQVTQAIADK